jgi:hypothetical protein
MAEGACIQDDNSYMTSCPSFRKVNNHSLKSTGLYVLRLVVSQFSVRSASPCYTLPSSCTVRFSQRQELVHHLMFYQGTSAALAIRSRHFGAQACCHHRSFNDWIGIQGNHQLLPC